jgi:aspartyl-tRNA(Asn)/glutamyl-tRNA(Gln) amidotransferase subunit A
VHIAVGLRRIRPKVGQIHELSAAELASAYQKKRLSPVEVMGAILDRLEKLNPGINAFREIDRRGALADAAASERRWHEGKPVGSLDGIPVSVKDMVPTKGMATLLGSKTVEPLQPWTQDAPAVANLRRHGAIIFGKTTTSEFGNKIVTESPLCGVTRNPWNSDRSSGGSSGGAAAAVAAGLGPLAVATDGGGSIRIPANWCGVFGFKPSHKRVPAPASAFGWLTVTGPIARTVTDAALMMTVMTEAGHDLDWQALPAEGLDYRSGIEDGIAGLRVAYSSDLGIANVEPVIVREIAAAAATLAELGAHVEEASVAPLAGYMESRIHSVQWMVNLSGIVRALPPGKRRLVDPDVLALAELGEAVPTAVYYDALNGRERLAQGMHEFFRDWDLLVCPTFHVGPPVVPGVPSRLREAPRLTSWVNQTMQPAASIPCGLDGQGLPVGLQIVARRHADVLVLRACRGFERVRGPFPMPS